MFTMIQAHRSEYYAQGETEPQKGEGARLRPQVGWCQAGSASRSFCSWPLTQGVVPGLPSALFPRVGGWSLWVLPLPLSLWNCHKTPSPPQVACILHTRWGRGRVVVRTTLGTATARPPGSSCPSRHGPHLDPFHAVLRGLG